MSRANHELCLFLLGFHLNQGRDCDQHLRQLDLPDPILAETRTPYSSIRLQPQICNPNRSPSLLQASQMGPNRLSLTTQTHSMCTTSNNLISQVFYSKCLGHIHNQSLSHPPVFRLIYHFKNHSPTIL